MSQILDDEPTGISWLDENPTSNDMIARLRREAVEAVNAKAQKRAAPTVAPTPVLAAPAPPAPVTLPPRKRGRPSNAEKAAREALLQTAESTLEALPSATPTLSEEEREEARTAVFGPDAGWNGWADFGPAKKDENGRWRNRLGLESTEAHRHVAKAWQESGCVNLRTFRQEQEQAAEKKWDATDMSLADLKVENGRFQFGPRPGEIFHPTPHSIYQLANLVGAKPGSVQALYDIEFSTLKNREEGENIPPPDHREERMALGDEILNKHISWLSPEVRERQRLYRFQNRGDQGQQCRAVLSNRYGIIDHPTILEILWEAIPLQGREDVLVSYVEDNGNQLSFSLLFPDAMKDAPDSEYGIGLKIRNAEDGTWALEYDAWLFRAICYNGSRWGLREGKKERSMRKIHHGQIDRDQLILRAKNAIKIGLSEGAAMFDLLQKSVDAPVPNPAQVIALTCKQAGVNQREAQAVARAFVMEPALNGFGISSAWTRAAQAFSGDVRKLFERTGASLMGPSLEATKADVKTHWEELSNMAKRLAEREAATVHQIQAVLTG